MSLPGGRFESFVVRLICAPAKSLPPLSASLVAKVLNYATARLTIAPGGIEIGGSGLSMPCSGVERRSASSTSHRGFPCAAKRGPIAGMSWLQGQRQPLGTIALPAFKDRGNGLLLPGPA